MKKNMLNYELPSGILYQVPKDILHGHCSLKFGEDWFLVLLTKECNLCLVYLIGNRKKIHSTYIRPYFCSGYPLDRTASHFETRIILFKQCIIWLVHMVISIFDAAHSELFLKLYFGNWSTYNLCYFYVWNMLDNFWKIHPPKSAKKEPRLAK